MKKFFTGILFYAVLLSGCSTMSQTTLEYRDTADFKVNYLSEGVLEISGSAPQSSDRVPKVVKTDIVGDTLDIIIELAPAENKAKRSFSFKIKIEPPISTVRFGPDKEIIWQRK